MSGGKDSHILNLNGVELLALRFDHFTTGKGTSVTCLIGYGCAPLLP